MTRKLSFVSAAIAMIILIANPHSAQCAAKEGVELCIQSVIPSLFPFILITNILNKNLSTMHFPFAKPICKLCRVPMEHSAYLLIGLFGGYPVGAKCINDAYHNKLISKEEGHRLLGFCSNAGPSFIFGMLGYLFAPKAAAFTLWGIHILSALLVGCILPPAEHIILQTEDFESKKTDVMIPAIKTMSIICVWVMIFRMIIFYLNNTIICKAPNSFHIIVSGFLELTNGCIQLSSLPCQGLRFILSSIFLAFGGICVAMQTVSVTRNIGFGSYFIGKFLQTLISVLLAYGCQHLIFDCTQQITIHWIPIFAIVVTLFLTILLLHQKSCSIPEKNGVY